MCDDYSQNDNAGLKITKYDLRRAKHPSVLNMKGRVRLRARWAIAPKRGKK